MERLGLPGFCWSKQHPFQGLVAMYQQFDSPAGLRFLAYIREGRGLKPSARAAGIGKETGYRWLREEYLRLRGEGLDHAA